MQQIYYPPLRDAPAVFVPLTDSERTFLLYRLADYGDVADAIVHHPADHLHVTPWQRGAVLAKTALIAQMLRAARPLLVVSRLDRAILVEAIEGNPYFVRMADHDPRLCALQIGRADTLRLKLARLLGITIGPVPLGAGRKRNVAAEWAQKKPPDPGEGTDGEV